MTKDHHIPMDEELMMGVKNGNLSNMSEIFQRYHVRIYNYFLKVCRDRSLSEDLTQNVFERALKYRYSYKDSFPFKAWIYKIASNVKYDHYRSKMVPVTDGVDIQNVKSYAEDPRKEMEGNEMVDKLNSALKKLTEEQQKIIWLTKYEHMKYAQVAEMMGTTESAMKVKIHRAMKRLRQIYFEQ